MSILIGDKDKLDVPGKPVNGPLHTIQVRQLMNLLKDGLAKALRKPQPLWYTKEGFEAYRKLVIKTKAFYESKGAKCTGGLVDHYIGFWEVKAAPSWPYRYRVILLQDDNTEFGPIVYFRSARLGRVWAKREILKCQGSIDLTYVPDTPAERITIQCEVTK